MKERLVTTNDLLAENQEQLDRLLDLYLSGEFSKEMLAERKTRLEQTIAALERERDIIITQVEERTLTSEQVQSVNDFAAEVKRSFSLINEDDFEAKRTMLEQLDVQVKLTIEEGQKVAYVSSLVLGKSRDLSVISSTA